jgi:pSer/pThr/pTyr-binding forkhead associated (FHA) protein
VGSGVTEAAVNLRLQDGTLHEIGQTLKIGRNPDNDMVLDDPQVSGSHAEIRRGENEVVVVDLESRNGTFVNEVQVTTPQTLRHNDVLRLGATQMTFILQVMAPRSETGPAGLPDEPLDRPQTTANVIARLTWDGRSFEVTEDVFQIGRDEEGAKVHLEDPAASWLHAEVTRHGDSLYLRDLGSRNGTYVNGELVAVPHPLADGDVIHIGNTDLTFHGSTPAAATQPSPSAIRPGSAVRSGVGLLCMQGRFLGVWFAIPGRSATVGRDASCDVTIADLTVSRRHAELRQDEEGWRISDLGSTNGTVVRGEPLERGAWVTVAQGDEIKMGNIVVTLADRASAPSGVRSASQVEPPPDATPSARTAMMQTPERTVPPETPSEITRAPEQPAEATHAVDSPGRIDEEQSVTALLVIAGPAQGREFPLHDLPLVLGREDADDVTGLGDGYISSRHLKVDRAPDGNIEVTDLGSTNGTWHGDEQLAPNTPTKLARGDKLRLGPMTILEAD